MTTESVDDAVIEATAYLNTQIERLQAIAREYQAQVRERDVLIAAHQAENARLAGELDAAYAQAKAFRESLISEKELKEYWMKDAERLRIERDHLQWAAEEHFAALDKVPDEGFAEIHEVEVPNDDEVVSYAAGGA